MAAKAAQSWASVPWAAVQDTSGGSTVLGWHKHHVPYAPGALSQQNPRRLDTGLRSSSEVPPSSSSLPARPGRWIVFIHGGAWRDPMVTSSAFAPTARISSSVPRRLAHHRQAWPRSTSASPSILITPPTRRRRKMAQAPDPARQARHPDHISDVLAALAFPAGRRRRHRGLHALRPQLRGDAVIPGCHGPGAVGQRARSAQEARGPDEGFNRLYDLAGFISNPPASHAHLVSGYEDFKGGLWRRSGRVGGCVPLHRRGLGAGVGWREESRASAEPRRRLGCRIANWKGWRRVLSLLRRRSACRSWRLPATMMTYGERGPEWLKSTRRSSKGCYRELCAGHAGEQILLRESPNPGRTLSAAYRSPIDVLQGATFMSLSNVPPSARQPQRPVEA